MAGAAEAARGQRGERDRGGGEKLDGERDRRDEPLGSEGYSCGTSSVGCIIQIGMRFRPLLPDRPHRYYRYHRCRGQDLYPQPCRPNNGSNSRPL